MKKIGIAVASIAAASLLALTAGATQAATPDATFNARYAAMDANGDGVVSVTEFGAAAQKFLDAQKASGFATIDANADGTISFDELFHPASLVVGDAAPVVTQTSYTSETTGVSMLHPVIEVYQIIDNSAE
jgi:Ca2+-binding EF-hand superfamily protein